MDGRGMDQENGKVVSVETNIYDEVIEYTNCTVQILRNSATGEESVGWWINEEEQNGQK